MTKDEMKKVVCQAIDEATEKIHETVLRLASMVGRKALP